MSKGFDELLALAQIDRQLVGIKKIRDAFPADVARQQLRCDAAAAASAEVENSARALQADIDKANLEIRACNQEISALNTKIGIVKNTKEYAIITERIKDMKESIGQYEEKQLAAMDELDALKNTLKEKNQEVEAASAAMAELNQEITVKTAALKEQQKELIAARNKQIANVNAAGEGLLAIYNAALQRGKGLAFAELSAGVCTECHRKASANLVSLVTARAQLEKCVCAGCGRLLFIS